MIFDLNENYIKYIHLRKFIFKKKLEMLDISYNDISKHLNFRHGIYLINMHYEYDKKEMDCRVHYFLSKNQIPYGLKSSYSFNCESFVYYILLGIRLESREVKRFEERFGKLGKFLIFIIDKVVICTNFIGEIEYFLKKEKKNNQ